MTRRLLAVTSTGQVSGAERVLVHVLAAASRSGWQVTCAAPAGPLADELAAAGVPHVALPELGLAPGSRLIAYARTLLRWMRAARVVRRAAAAGDLVLVNALTALPVVRLAHVRPPVAWLAHDVVVRADRLRMFRLCRPALARVIAVSAAVADRLRHTGVRIDVVHNGVPWPVEPASGAPGDSPVVGISALLTPWKGHHVLLDAVPMLDDGVSVEIMGGNLVTDTDFAASIRARCSEPALRDRVRILGHVADPLAQMRSWTVAVSASVAPEACPLNVLEAMSLGVPVVATDHGGAPEVLAGTGLLVPPGDPGALAEAINTLLRDAALRGRCASSAKERVAVSHRQDRQTETLLDVLTDICGAAA